MDRTKKFRRHLVDAGVIDPEGVHHEFKSKNHGQKIDFDKVPRHSLLYQEWVDMTASFLVRRWVQVRHTPRDRRRPLLLFGVANGTNEFALDVAAVTPNAVGFETEKDEANKVRLTRTGKQAIEVLNPLLVVFLEDVSTTGQSAATPALEAMGIRSQKPRVLTAWKRQPNLEALDRFSIPYDSLIQEALPTYSPEECRNLEEGFCRQWGEPIPYGSPSIE